MVKRHNLGFTLQNATQRLDRVEVSLRGIFWEQIEQKFLCVGGVIVGWRVRGVGMGMSSYFVVGWEGGV